MRDRTPEFYQIDKIVDEAVSGGLLSGDDDGVDTDTRFIRNLAAPLEAANARIKTLEHALRLLERSASTLSNRDGQSKAHRTAADWSRLNSHIDIARAAIEAAKEEKK